MLTFFGTIIIVYFLWLVVKPMLARYMQRKFQQKVNDMFGQMFGQAPGQSDSLTTTRPAAGRMPTADTGSAKARYSPATKGNM